MIKLVEKVGFGGSCHWCTEAIFQALRGVHSVLQGYISAPPPDERFSEAVLLEFDPAEITLATLIEVHLRTHSCTSSHGLRAKYRSAVYVFDEEQAAHARDVIALLQADFDNPIITRVLAFSKFEASPERYQNYYKTDPNRPFCQTNIDPKLKIIRERFGAHAVNETSQC
jgi:peptide-methionine (S)-S-oxide reductase